MLQKKKYFVIKNLKTCYWPFRVFNLIIIIFLIVFFFLEGC